MEKATIFALGIMPYISASIILQLFQAVIPYFEKLAKENSRLKARIGLDDIYIALLEQALEAAGMLSTSVKPPAVKAAQPQPRKVAAKRAGARRLRLAGMARR